ncbi:competence protein CoiA [Gottfriedia sp. NPDC057991]|uniref:competence protein CoiA n=1 Tax=Gottfriedia sp. NPDC057991 TaxID=3346298 RepID=UPI0036DD8F62
MIVALNTERHTINLFEVKTTEELLRLKQNGPYFCPICKNQVRLKIGVKKVTHFAHIDLTECENEKKESIDHYKGKFALYQFFKKFNVNVEVEKFLPKLNQRPDLFIRLNTIQICVEYQCSVIPLEKMIKRTNSFKQSGMKVLWILNDKLLNQKRWSSFYINSLSIYSLVRINVFSLLFYNPTLQSFTVLSSLIAFSPVQYIGQKDVFPINNFSFKGFLSPNRVDKKVFVSKWNRLKKDFRLYQHLHTKGNLKVFKQYLYNANMNYFPAVIGVPLESNCIIKEHCIFWQGQIYFKFFHEVEIGQLIFIDKINQSVKMEVQNGKWRVNQFQDNEIDNLEKCVEKYIDFLVKIRIVKRIKNGKIMKIANAIIPSSFQQALDEDCLSTNTAFDLLFNARTDSNDY